MQINKHGSFYIRNGWPTKIVDAITNDTLIFSPNNELKAVDEIGVGRVMIKAMRYWAVALGLSTETKTQGGISHELTALGRMIRQADPYFQDQGTLWLLHRNLTSEIGNATAWYWAFNELGTKTFSKETFTNGFHSFLQKNGEKYTRNAVEKEFDCLKNTYASDKAFDIDKILDEDTVPFFAPLKLIQFLGDGKYEMRRSSVKDIPLDIVLYCILADNADHLLESQQISIDVLLEGTNQIGKYMNLSYATLLELLQQLDNSSKIVLVNNFGNKHIQIKNACSDVVLNDHYRAIARS